MVSLELSEEDAEITFHNCPLRQAVMLAISSGVKGIATFGLPLFACTLMRCPALSGTAFWPAEGRLSPGVS